MQDEGLNVLLQQSKPHQPDMVVVVVSDNHLLALICVEYPTRSTRKYATLVNKHEHDMK